MTSYYNEHDPYAAQWLRNLIAAGHIAPGDVDERSIEDVYPSDIEGYKQCHFFAGIGGWSRALRLSGWPDDLPVWTGSCPCQPFSATGKKAGFADERHLWPAWHHLISQRNPQIVFGEQVASKDGYAWLDLVQTDMEAAGYAFGPVVLPAAGFGAPHGRHRIFFVADAHKQQRNRRGDIGAEWRVKPAKLGGTVRLADASSEGLEKRISDREFQCSKGQLSKREAAFIRGNESVDDSAGHGTSRYWAEADWLPCRDGMWRPVEPGTFPLAHGVASRVGKLRAYGNAIVPQVAEAFIRAYIESVW